MSDIAIKVENIGKQYRIGGPQKRYYSLRENIEESVAKVGKFLSGNGRWRTPKETIWALKDVSFEVKHGEVIGIIGRNGAGKTTLLKILSRITEPTEGRVELNGRVGSLLEVGTGFHPELTGRENIYLSGAILGMKHAEIDRKFDEIVDFSEIEKFLDTPVKRYSSGMHVRLAFAVAAHLEPEILLVDEVLAVGDAQFQKKCLGKMEDVATRGRTVIFVSHNMAAIQNITNKCILLNDGNLLLYTNTHDVVKAYIEKRNTYNINYDLKSNRDDFKIKSIRFDYDFLRSGFNKPLKFDFDLFLKRNLSNVIFGFAIVNSIDAKIITSISTIKKLTSGKNELSLILKDHHLPPGNYTINLGITIHGFSILYRENVLGFEISDLNIDDPILTQKRDKIGCFIESSYIIRGEILV